MKTSRKTIFSVAALLFATLFMYSFQSASHLANPDKKKGKEDRPNAAVIRGNTFLVVSAYEQLSPEGKPQLAFWLEDGRMATFTGDSVAIAGNYRLADARNSGSSIVVFVNSYGYSPVEAEYQFAESKGVYEVSLKGSTKKGESVEFYYRGTPTQFAQANGSGRFACGKEKHSLTAAYICHEKKYFRYYFRNDANVTPVHISCPTPITKKEYDLSQDTTITFEVQDPKNPSAFFKIRNGLLKVKRSGDKFTLNFEGESPMGDIKFEYKGEVFTYGSFTIEYGKNELYYTETPYQQGKEIITPQYRVKAQ